MKNLIVSVNIVSDGNRTVAQAKLLADARISLEGVSAFGSSGREPGDKPNPVVGENLATARALRSLANRLERQANGALRHAESIKEHKKEIAERQAGWESSWQKSFGWKEQLRKLSEAGS